MLATKAAMIEFERLQIANQWLLQGCQQRLGGGDFSLWLSGRSGRALTSSFLPSLNILSDLCLVLSPSAGRPWPACLLAVCGGRAASKSVGAMPVGRWPTAEAEEQRWSEAVSVCRARRESEVEPLTTRLFLLVQQDAWFSCSPG